MAYSSVRVQFEIGHEASVRTKKTPEGFTHDWEVFVRGADNTDIQCFVDKVVFHLHETFPKPRRVIKEPPYLVKESGYAGFVLPIDVYLKNKEEPKKISFQYDLTLQPSGPPISRVLREPRLFQNPSEDFRRKLIRGGGVGVDTPSEVQTEDLKAASSLGGTKSKLIESPAKKHKPDLVPNDSFAQLFGTPIRRTESKKLPELPKKTPEMESSKDKKKTSKHGSYKDEKEIVKEKEKYLEKERMKEREKMKEKPPKRPPSPPPIPQIMKSKEDRKHEEKEKKKEDHEDKKKKKEDRDKKEKTKDVREVDKALEHKKEKKELKEGDYVKKLNSTKPYEMKPNCEKQHNIEGIEKERPEKEKHKHRHKKKEKEKNRDKEKHRKDKDKSEKESREREKEKDKSMKKRHEETREKEEKMRRKSRSPSPVPERTRKGPLNALLDELGSSDSASPLSEDEPLPPSFKSVSKPLSKVVPEIKTQSPVVNISPKLKSTNLNTPVEIRPEKEVEKPAKIDDVVLAKTKKDKLSSKKSKKSEKDAEKRRTKEEHRGRSTSSEKEDEDGEKERLKDDRLERLEEGKPKSNKDKENRKRKGEKSEEKHGKTRKGIENNLTASQSGPPVEVADGPEEIRRSDKFTKEYVAQLKDLQHRIMTLEDNAELQKVVKVIADTGQYEITKKTFDFDLCALDLETVKRLQEFFVPT